MYACTVCKDKTCSTCIVAKIHKDMARKKQIELKRNKKRNEK